MQFALDEQIASQPAAVAARLARIDVPTLDSDRPLILTGIGTSLHACFVAAAWITELSNGTIRPSVYAAHDLALTLPIRAQDQVIVVSHRGTKRFPNAVLARARSIGARTVAVVGEGAPEPVADAIVRTCPDERSSTHTVSYVTALVALGQLVARLLGSRGDVLLSALQTIPIAIEETLTYSAPVALAERLVGREPYLVAGCGVDALTAAETALKIKEGTYQWAEGMAVELALHGPPAAFRANMGAILLTPAVDDGGRTQELRTLLHELGAEVATCGEKDEDVRFAAVHRLARPLVAIVPLQRLVAEMARLRGSNPDAIHLDVEPWQTALGHVVL